LFLATYRLSFGLGGLLHSTVYAYRVTGADTQGQHVEAFVGVTIYESRAVNSFTLSSTRTDLGGLVSVR
jgi:hypothetical protein